MRTRLMDLLEQLEDIIDRAGKVPLTSKIMIDEEVLLEILDGIRTAIPQEVRQANLVLQDRDRMMEDARADGQRIIDRAQAQAEQLIEEGEIVTQSRAYGEEIVRKAQQYSRDVKLGALRYSDELLQGIEMKLQEAFKAIESSRDELSAMAHWDEKSEAIIDEDE